jgi:hypothetical protein
MPTRSSTYSRPVEDAEIRKLKDELWVAQNTIFELMSEEAKKILASYHDCVTVDETYGWAAHIGTDLLPLAKPLPRVSAFHFGDRAMCPLCGRQAQTLYEEGFAYPEGLLRHFEGRGNVHRCGVIEAVRGLANAYWDRTFFPRGSTEREALVAKLESRRRQEMQFKVHPYHPPRLLDEGPASHRARDGEGLKWAHARLIALGFQVSHNEKVSTCTRDSSNAVAYADPRKAGVISVNVFLKPFTEDLNYWEQRRVPFRAFTIVDTRKHGLEAYVEEEVATAVREMAPALRPVGGVA